MRREEPRLGVLLPYRDAAPTLREALLSVLEDDVPLEVLAIDDGSRDGGPALVEALAARDPRIRPLSTGGAGLVAALELGRARTAAPFLARMDADDVSLPGRLSASLALLETTPSLAAVGVRVEVFSEGGDPGEGMRRYVEWQNALVSPADHARELFVESPLCHPATTLRASAVAEVGGYREGPFPEDYDLWLRLDAGGHGLAKVPETLLRWRRHPGQTTWSTDKCTPARLRELKARHLAPRLLERGRSIAIWGAGAGGGRLARALSARGVEVARFVDVDPAKVGRRRHGVPVVGHDSLARDEAFVLAAVGTRGAREAIRAHLRGLGRLEGEDFVCVA